MLKCVCCGNDFENNSMNQITNSDGEVMYMCDDCFAQIEIPKEDNTDED